MLLPLNRQFSPLWAVSYSLLWLFCYYLASSLFPVGEQWPYQIIFLLIPAAWGMAVFSPQETSLLSRPGFKEIGLVLLATVAVSLLLNWIMVYWSHLFPQPEVVKEYYDRILKTGSTQESLIKGITLGLIPAVSEEFLFRGFLQGHLENKWGGRKALLAASFLFGLCHLNIRYFPFFFLLGLYLGKCQLSRHNLVLPILAHWINNIIALGLYKIL